MRQFLESKYKEWGDKTFTRRVCALIEDKESDFSDKLSIKALWEAIGEPNFKREMNIQRYVKTDEELTEALDSSVFPKITAALINKFVQEAYDLEPGIGFNLVTKIPSTKEEETITGFADDHEMKVVNEGMPYQEGAITEKYHKVKNRKFGRIVPLTMEMIKFDQTGQMKMRAGRVGESARIKQDSIIMDAVLGNVNTGDFAAWRPNGDATTLYNDASNDPFTSGNQDNVIVDVLADETDLDAAMVLFAAMTDEQGSPMFISPKILLTAVSLVGVGAKIVGSGQSVVATTPAGVKNIYNNMTHLWSAWLDQKLGTTYWLFGDFKKQFVYTEVFPLATKLAKPGNEQEFERDISFRYKGGFMGGCGALSNRFVVRSTGAGS